MNPDPIKITGAQILEAVQACEIYAELREETQSLAALSETNPEAMPRAVFAVMLDEDRPLIQVVCAYNVELKAAADSFDEADFEVVPFQGFPRGASVSLQRAPEGGLQLRIEVPPFLPQPPAVDLAGLSEEEAAEVVEFIGELLGDSYQEWEPELPDEEQIHAALVELEAAARFAMQIHDQEVGVDLRAGTHLGLTVIAVEHDYEPKVHTTVKAAAKAARDALEEDLRQAADGASELGLDDLERELLESPELADARVMTTESRARR